MRGFEGATGDWGVGEDAFPHEHEGLTGDRRTEARLCAVQFLFGVLVQPVAERPSGALACDGAVKDFYSVRGKKTGADKKLFATISQEALASEARYTTLLEANMLENWQLARIDPVQHALLWAAAAELTGNAAVGPKVVINEFVNIAKGFAPPAEVAFINAMLDRLARKIRPQDFDLVPADTATAGARG